MSITDSDIRDRSDVKIRTTQEIQRTTKQGSDREIAIKSSFSKMNVTKGK